MSARKQRLSADPRVKTFAEAASSFCGIIERRSRLNKREFVHRCAEAVPKILSRFMTLLDVETRRDLNIATVEQRRFRVPDKRWWELFRSLSRKLGRSNGYHEVFDPYLLEKDDPVHASLGDDLADIYRDLKQGVSFYQQGDELSQQTAVYLWKLNMRIHAANHCASAVRALSSLIEHYHEDDRV